MRGLGGDGRVAGGEIVEGDFGEGVCEGRVEEFEEALGARARGDGYVARGKGRGGWSGVLRTRGIVVAIICGRFCARCG